jgi:hypothetical protein
MKYKKHKIWVFAVAISAVWITGAIGVPGDADGDGRVGIEDVFRVAEWWTIDFCDFFNQCNGADMTGPEGERDGVVDLYDFALIAAHWLEEDAAE